MWKGLRAILKLEPANKPVGHLNSAIWKLPGLVQLTSNNCEHDCVNHDPLAWPKTAVIGHQALLISKEKHVNYDVE